MALSKLSGDEQGIIFSQLCNVLDPRVAVAFSSASNELRELTQGLLQQLRAEYEVASTLCRKVGMRSCKELREARVVCCHDKSLTTADLTLLFTLGSVLPALQTLSLANFLGHDSVQQLAAGLGAGALPAVIALSLDMHVGDAGALALADALGRGALPQLRFLSLIKASIGDAGLVALAPALRRLPALEELDLQGNPFGDEGLTALVAPPQPAGALPPRTGVLTRLKRVLYLNNTQVSDAGCDALASALDNGAMPDLEGVYLDGIPASAAAKAAVYEALARMEPLPVLEGFGAVLGPGTPPMGSRRRAPFSLPWRSQSPLPLRPPRRPPAMAPIAAEVSVLRLIFNQFLLLVAKVDRLLLLIEDLFLLLVVVLFGQVFA